jgi:predicted O-linked N-acetylglucosamine transferase (SPINDLY family)
MDLITTGNFNMQTISEMLIRAHHAFQKKDIFEAHNYYSKALKLDSKNATIHSNLGTCYIEMKQWQKAFEHFQIGLELDINHAGIHTNLSHAYRLIGCMPEAVAHIKKVVALEPDSPVAQSNLLLYLNYCPNVSSDELFTYHRQWGNRFSMKPKNQLNFSNYPDPDRPIRLAYISPDFRGHSVGYFIEPALLHYNPKQFEIFCYAHVPTPDQTTEKIQKHVNKFYLIHTMNDQQVANQIRADGIDILVDLSGHTANSRIRIMTYQAAPIQVTYLGYPTTSGLKHIDYRLTDTVIDPKGSSDSYFTEQLIYLDPYFFCLSSLGNSLPISPSPALINKKICFGAFHNTSKVSECIIQLWSKVLLQIPESKILLQASAYDDPDIVRYFQTCFEKYGIKRHRVKCIGTLPFEQYIKLHHQIDIMLDTQPWTGHTTSCHALWMGIPILTLAGTRHASRIGQRLLLALDLKEWIARDHQDFVEKAVNLTKNLSNLNTLRKNMRNRIIESGISNRSQYVHSLEKAFSQLWVSWCNEKRSLDHCFGHFS